jgi:tetratricopeptide (TPR) repeat protein
MKPDALIDSKQYQAAVELLEGKSDSHSRALCAYAYCFLQREEDAAHLISDLPYSGGAELAHSTLATYFASRAQLTQKLGKKDQEGAKWAKKYADHPNFQGKSKLSAVLIVKNEAAHIERCLRSIGEIADEIVLVDTGSTDGTMEIAAGLGLNLTTGTFDWCDDFSAARNVTLQLATGDWALWIDADEALEADGLGELLQGIIRPNFGGYFIRILNFTGDGGDNSTYTHSAYRLFQRLPGVKWEGRIHEQVVDSDPKRDLPNGNLGTATLLHYGYRPSEMEAKGKSERFLTMLEREVRANPGDAFQWFNLANAYTVTGQLTEAEHAARNAVALAADEAPYLSIAYQLLANSLTQTQKPEAALVAIKESEQRGCDLLFVEFERANALLTMGRLEPALEAIDASMQFEWSQHQLGDQTMAEYKRQVVRGQILSLMGKFGEAVEMFDYALARNPEYVNAIYLKAATLSAMERFEEAAELFTHVAQTKEFASLGLTGLGRALSAQGRSTEAASAFEAAWKLSPSDYNAWAAWAEACEAAKDLDTVVRAYSAFATENEPTPEILVNWGRALERTGQQQRALDCFSEALRRAPEDPNAYFNCGDLLFRCGAYQDAAHLYEGGLRIRQDYAPGWLVLGNSLAQMGLVDGARIAYTEALRLDPAYSEASHNLAVINEPAAA